MMTTDQWKKTVYATSAINLKPIVAKEAREQLGALDAGVTITTAQLVERMFPVLEAEKSLPGDIARKAIFTQLGRLADEEMMDCCKKGEVNGQFMGRPKRPWLWFKPPERETCCMCGQLLPAEVV